MDAWIELIPREGWDAFSRSKELSDAIWSGLSENGGLWHYTNFTAQSSTWESSEDGSALSMAYEAGDSERLVELRVSAGHASTYLLPIATRFGLISGPFPAR